MEMISEEEDRGGDSLCPMEMRQAVYLGTYGGPNAKSQFSPARAAGEN
jgi:hypothetical protein